MDLVYFITVSILVKFTILIDVNGDCLLSTEVLQPQLSTTFLQGYWFEQLYINKAIQNESCSHIQVKCNSSAATCKIQNQKWQSYYLIILWNGTISQTTDEVQLNVTSNGTKAITSYTVNLKFHNDALLIWSCNDTEILFASTLFRMENNDDMTNIWAKANANMDFPEIIENTPAGVWMKAEPTSCSGGNRYPDNTILFYLLLILNLSKIGVNFLIY